MTLVSSVRRMPISFRDPLYAQLARAAEEQYGLPVGILDAIRTRGEMSNANQVNSAGAQTPYQFIPSTRRGMIRNYGIDPYADAQSATNAAAQLLVESHRRTGSWDRAVAGYHGGIRAERGRGGPQNRAYVNRVGSFDEDKMGQSLYPLPYYGVDPLAPLNPMSPEPMAQTVPDPGNPGPSIAMPAASPVASKKRGGLLGALESVFMPDPDSRWAAALRGGIWDAKANQQTYKNEQYNNALKTMETEAKLKNLLTKGEYQVVGNNVFHIKPDGSTEMIAPPATKSDKIQLFEKWQSMGDNDPAKELLERMLAGANADEVLANKIKQARIRAGATTGSAQIRANVTRETNKAKNSKPPTGFILDD